MPETKNHIAISPKMKGVFLLRKLLGCFLEMAHLLHLRSDAIRHEEHVFLSQYTHEILPNCEPQI